MAPLIGRDGAVSELRGAIKATDGGSGGCCLIEGPAGIGKTRLLEAACDEARARGMTAASGQATQLDRVAPLSTLFTPLRSVVGSLDGADSGDLQQANRLRQLDCIREAIEQYTREQPLVIVLDDVQWADELSALALRMLVPALASSPVLWLLARRLGVARTVMRESIDRLVQEDARRIRLGPLSDDAVAELSASLLGARPDDALRALAERSAGNPFLLEELLRSLQDAGQIRLTEGTAALDVDSPELPADFLNAVEQRLFGLSSETVRLLETGAVLRRPFTLHEAAGLIDLPPATLVPFAEEAVEAGTLVESGCALAFRHDLIREAVYQRLTGPVRSALHREAAVVLRQEGHSAAEVAEHLLQSGERGDARALDVLRDAIDQVAPTAPATAADLILRMLDLLPEDDDARSKLVVEAVRLLAAAGRVPEARKLAESALGSGLRGGCEATLLLGLAEALKHIGHNEEVVALTRRGLDRPGIPTSTQSRLLAIQAHGLLHCDCPVTAEEAGSTAADLAERSGSHEALVLARTALSSATRAQGYLARALEHAQDAVDVADRMGGESRHRHPRLWLVPALTALDKLSEAESVYRFGTREAQQLGTAWSQPLWHYYSAMLRLAAGELDDAAAEAAAGLQVAEQLSAMALGVPLLALLGRLDLERGDVADARRHLRRAEELQEEGISAGPEALSWATGLMHAASGEPAAALSALEVLYEQLDQRPLLLTQDPAAAAQMVRIARAADAPEHGTRVVATAQELVKRNPDVPSLRGAAAHAEGLWTGDLDLLRQAVEAFRGSPRPLARASALEDTARAEGDRGNSETCLELLEEALEHHEQARAERSVARLQRELRALGIRRKSRRRERKGSPSSSLTESEWRVARLVAEGLTNREVADQLFLSPHTVDSHLRHSFTKLGVNTRVELTRHILSELEEEDPEKT